MHTRTKLILAVVAFAVGMALLMGPYQSKAVAGILAVMSAALLIWAEVGRGR